MREAGLEGLSQQERGRYVADPSGFIQSVSPSPLCSAQKVRAPYQDATFMSPAPSHWFLPVSYFPTRTPGLSFNVLLLR